MTNSPLAPHRINRRHVYFPIDGPVGVEPGELVDVSMRILPEDSLVVWQVQVRAATSAVPRAEFEHSTWRGMLLDREELTRTRPGHRPRLTPRGLARLSVLALANGDRTVGEIEREVLQRHGSLFRSADEATFFVAEVLTRYTE